MKPVKVAVWKVETGWSYRNDEEHAIALKVVAGERVTKMLLEPGEIRTIENGPRFEVIDPETMRGRITLEAGSPAGMSGSTERITLEEGNAGGKP